MKREMRNHSGLMIFQPMRCRRRLGGCQAGEPILRLNLTLDAISIPGDVNEFVIEDLLRQWAQHGRDGQPLYWLFAARLFELAIACAGHYVDHCEFKLAGDLLFNPRQVLVYRKGSARPTVKRRHGGLSGQFHDHRATGQPFPVWFRQHAITRTTQPAIVPFLLNAMVRSGRMTRAYLQSAHGRIQKAAEAICFLGAWSISTYEDLHRRLQRASRKTRRFIADHLCAFDSADYDALGKEIRHIAVDPCHPSRFIAGSGPAHAAEPGAND